MAIVSKQRSVYYGWFIVAACFTVMLCLGEVTWSFGVFFKSIEAEFGWSRSVTSSCYTLMILGYGLGAIAAGRLTDRYSARPVFLASAMVAGPAIMLCSTIDSVAHLQTLLFVAGLGTGALLSSPASTVQRWFHGRSRSGVALALVMAGVGAGGLVFAPIINYLIDAHGWRCSFICAGGFFLVAVAISGLVVRPLPKLNPEPGTSSGSPVPTRVTIRNPRFILISGIMGVSVFGFQIVNVHLVPYLTDIGIASTTAAAALGLAGGFSVVGRLTSGVLSGRLGWGRTFALSQTGVGVSMLLLLMAGQVWMLYVTIAIYGVSQGARAVSVMGTMGRIFGMRGLGELTGIMMAAAQLGGAAGPYAAGYMHDALGSYGSVLVALAVMLLVCGALILRFLVDPSVRSNARREVAQPLL